MFTAFGGALLLMGLRASRKPFRLTRVGVEARATVVKREYDPESTIPDITVEFEDRAGVRHRVRLFYGSKGPEVGEVMEILYDPDDPDNASGRNSLWMWTVPAFCLGFGVFIVLMAWFGEVSGGNAG
jgi:hypothetical protein